MYNDLLFIGDKITVTFHTMIPKRDSWDKTFIVSKVTKTLAIITDGSSVYKVKRDISNGFHQCPKDRRAFRSNWVTFSKL